MLKYFKDSGTCEEFVSQLILHHGSPSDYRVTALFSSFLNRGRANPARCMLMGLEDEFYLVRGKYNKINSGDCVQNAELLL